MDTYCLIVRFKKSIYFGATLSNQGQMTHTCEPPDSFLGHLPISNILPNSPDFYMFLPNSPDFYMFASQMCNLHHVHLGQGSKMQIETGGILNPLHSADVFDSHFKICFNNFIYPPWVDYFTLG